MSFAVIRTGGKQFSVEAGDRLRVPSIEAEAGSKIELETLITGDGKAADFGSGKVAATIVKHGRAEKIIVFKKKRRKQYKRTQGHRQGFTEIKIETI